MSIFETTPLLTSKSWNNKKMILEKLKPLTKLRKFSEVEHVLEHIYSIILYGYDNFRPSWFF